MNAVPFRAIVQWHLIVLAFAYVAMATYYGTVNPLGLSAGAAPQLTYIGDWFASSVATASSQWYSLVHWQDAVNAKLGF